MLLFATVVVWRQKMPPGAAQMYKLLRPESQCNSHSGGGGGVLCRSRTCAGVWAHRRACRPQVCGWSVVCGRWEPGVWKLTPADEQAEHASICAFTSTMRGMAWTDVVVYRVWEYAVTRA
eukprot:365813-Chlamydomonas_euryale.AAC.21